MRTFYNRSNVLAFPLMPKQSDKNVTFNPCNTHLLVSNGHQSRYLSPDDAAALAFVSPKTVYKWISGTHPISPATQYLLQSRALGVLPHHNWQGWHIDETGKLIAGNGYSFQPDELLNFSYIKQLNGELQAQVARLNIEKRQLQDAIDYLQARPTLANVVRFPQRPKLQAQKKPG